MTSDSTGGVSGENEHSPVTKRFRRCVTNQARHCDETDATLRPRFVTNPICVKSVASYLFPVRISKHPVMAGTLQNMIDTDSEDEMPPAWEERVTFEGKVYYAKYVLIYRCQLNVLFLASRI